MKNIPKILATISSILYICLYIMLSLDVKIFTVGFLIHSIPTIILLTTLVISQTKEKIGGALFIIEGLGTIIVFNTYRDLVTLLSISLVPIIIGIIFIYSKKH